MKRILYEVPKWHGILRREAMAEDGAMQEKDSPVTKFADEVFDRLYAGGGEPLPEAEQDERLKTWGARFHEAASQAPGWQRLTDDCRGDALAAAIATEKVLEVVQPKEDEQNQKLPPPKPGQPSPTDLLRRALTRVAVKAQQEIDDTREALEGSVGLGGWLPGTGAGKPTTSLGAAQVRALVKSLRGNPRIRRIMELAGRFKRAAAQKRRARVNHGADEVVDVELGDSLARMLPSEALRALDPDLEVLFFHAYVNRGLMQYRLEGKEAAKRGPVVVCIDKSSSMNGMRDEWATAVALAMLEQAQVDRRPFGLVAFDDGVRWSEAVPVGGKLSERSLYIEAHGGTSIRKGLAAALDIIEKSTVPGMQKADIILITDGGDSPAPEERERAAKLGVHIVGLGIGIGREAVEPFADEVHAIHDLTRVEEGAAEALFA